jgi:hypothetical protein
VLGSRLKAIVDGLFPQKTETPYSACAVAEQARVPARLAGKAGLG